MSDYPMLISNKLHSFRNFRLQIYEYIHEQTGFTRVILSFCCDSQAFLNYTHLLFKYFLSKLFTISL